MAASINQAPLLELRDVSKRFKAAVTLTKTDLNAACAAWDALAADAPDHLALVFNRGLCAEMLGQLDLAEEFYRFRPAPGRRAPPGRGATRRALDRIGRATAQQHSPIHLPAAPALIRGWVE